MLVKSSDAIIGSECVIHHTFDSKQLRSYRLRTLTTKCLKMKYVCN